MKVRSDTCNSVLNMTSRRMFTVYDVRVLVCSCLLLFLAQYKHQTNIMYSHALSTGMFNVNANAMYEFITSKSFYRQLK